MQGREGWRRAATCAVVAVAALGLAGNAVAKGKHRKKDPPVTTLSVAAVVNLPSGQHVTSFDIGWVDAALGLYFLADRTNAVVDVVDTPTNQIINQLAFPSAPFSGAQPSPDLSGPDGVVTGNNQVWVGDGNSTIKVFDEFTGGFVELLNTNGKSRADEGCFDPKDELMMFANDADSPPFVTIWSLKTFPATLKATIPMSGAPGAGPNATNGIEQCQYSAKTKRFYLNLPEVNGPGNDTAPGAVVEISPTTLTVSNVFTISLAACAGPQGMAANKDGSTMMLGCNASYASAAFETATGKTVAINDEGGVDEDYFSAKDNAWYLAASGPIYSGLQRVGIVNDDASFTPGVSFVTGIKSGLGGISRGGNHSVAADSGTGNIYVPIANNSGSDICTAHGGVDANGCIAVFKAN